MLYIELTRAAILAQTAPDFFTQIVKSPLLPIIVIIALLYFMMLRPEKAQRDKLRNQQASLKKNDRVVIAGGIFGVVVEAPKGGERIKVRVDENNNTTLRVMRSSVLQVLDDDSKESPAKDSTTTEPDVAKPADK